MYPDHIQDDEEHRPIKVGENQSVDFSEDDEKPTKPVVIASEHFRMTQLVLEDEEDKQEESNDISKLLLKEEEKKEESSEPSYIISNICYTEPPKMPNHRAGLFLDKPGACPLRPGTVAGQHGKFPRRGSDYNVSFEGCNKTNPRASLIWNARSCTGSNKPNLDRLGFQLIDVPPSKILSTTEGMKKIGEAHPETAQKLYSEIAGYICEASGAAEAFGYCHAMRVPNVTQSKEVSSSGYAGYAHTDLSHKSWANHLPELLENGNWSSHGPPGISSAIAQKAASASRYAVFSAWRYIGPSEKCRASHLAVLDHRTVEEADILHLALVANDCYGGNYRLTDSTKKKHEWYYYPEMSRDEVLLFTCFDSNHPAKKTTFSGTPIPTCIHSAIADPNPPENEPPRQSVDIRFLLIWD